MEDNRDNHPLDLSYLTEMVGDDPEFIIEIFETFIEQTPFYMAELEDTLLVKDWKKLANCAHKIKPTFSYVGRNDVKDSVQFIETCARNEQNIEIIPKKVEELHQILDEIYVQLDRTIAEVKTKFNMV
ncbi:Hpt domain-containing protein [Pedobacter jamesrossensis]|uniref:Hpt domain-containing protein n=1 Tax=Pedobacter jamesrossensis TaxID=1908238 RepID=A0ABV8NGI0_9SPHI